MPIYVSIAASGCTHARDGEMCPCIPGAPVCSVACEEAFTALQGAQRIARDAFGMGARRRGAHSDSSGPQLAPQNGRPCEAQRPNNFLQP